MKKKILLGAIIALSLALLVAVGGTIAYLFVETQDVVNTFTYGDINIDLVEFEKSALKESQYFSGDTLKMIPGDDITKDPTVIVKGGSEKCWLFVEITKSGNFDEFMEYTIVTDWTKLPDEDNVYYKVVETNDADQSFPVLAGNEVHVKESVLKTQLNALDPGENGTWEAEELAKLPWLSFTAYAVQHKNVETVEEAWAIAKAKGGVPTATPESSDAPADSQ